MAKPLPSAIQHFLNSQGVSNSSIQMYVCSDISIAGQYEAQWLVVTDEKVFVLDSGSAAGTGIRSYNLAVIDGCRTWPTVGSGLFQIRIDGTWIDLLRYSNRLKFIFDRVQKRLPEIQSRTCGSMNEGVEVEGRDPQRCDKCGLMLEFAGETCPRCLDHGAALNRVVHMIKPYRRSAAALLALLFSGLILDMVWPLLTRFLVDYVLTQPRPEFYSYLRAFADFDSRTLLLFVVGGLASVHVLRAIINMGTSRLSAWVGNMMTFEVRSQLVRKLEDLGLAYYSKQETGSLVGRVAYDTEAIQGFMSQITSGFVMQFLMVIFSFVMMFLLEPSLALWALVPAPFVIGGALVYWRYVHPRYQRFWDRTSKQAGLLNGLLTGIRVVKAFAKERYELERFEAASGDVRASKDALDRTAAFFYPVMGIVFQVGGWIIWYIGGMDVLRGEISLGTLMAFFGYLSMFYGPLGSLTNLTTWLTQFSTQIHRISEILDAPTVIPEAEDPTPLPHARGHIEIRDAVFSYTRGSPVLRGLNLEFRPGEQIGIVGRSGSGKTSLINLIYRFYDLDSGEIRFDGVNIRELSKEDLRKHISIVLQEPFLFHGTLMENIAYGHPHARPEAVIEASRAASAHDFILDHQLAYETSVGERGQELSGGERQRISIARALLRESPVLILDEATSAIDSESEMSIQMALNDVARSRTTFIIAHRLSTLQNCDRIYVIENGLVAEIGTHQELMNADGLYARWARMQLGRTYIEWDEEPVVPPRNTSQDIPALATHRIRWLAADKIELDVGVNGDLQARIQGEPLYRGVFALRCFPVSYPESYISLRFHAPDGRLRELGLIRDLERWPEDAKKLIREALTRRYLFHRIERVYQVRKFSQFLAFQTQTHLGRVDFVVRYTNDAIKKYGERGRLLMDIEDNLYVIPDVLRMRSSDRSTFDRYVYW
ncbi:MAG: DUF1854 domain-containing protein [Bdellovibrionales bacterium]